MPRKEVTTAQLGIFSSINLEWLDQLSCLGNSSCKDALQHFPSQHIQASFVVTFVGKLEPDCPTASRDGALRHEGLSHTVMIFRQILKQIRVTVFKGSYFQPEPLFPSETNDPKGPLRRYFSASQPWFDHRFAVYYEMTKRAFDSWLWCRTVSLRTFSLGKILSDLSNSTFKAMIH